MGQLSFLVVVVVVLVSSSSSSISSQARTPYQLTSFSKTTRKNVAHPKTAKTPEVTPQFTMNGEAGYGFDSKTPPPPPPPPPTRYVPKHQNKLNPQNSMEDEEDDLLDKEEEEEEEKDMFNAAKSYNEQKDKYNDEEKENIQEKYEQEFRSWTPPPPVNTNVPQHGSLFTGQRFYYPSSYQSINNNPPPPPPNKMFMRNPFVGELSFEVPAYNNPPAEEMDNDDPDSFDDQMFDPDQEQEEP